jgi:hypothetical protein
MDDDVHSRDRALARWSFAFAALSLIVSILVVFTGNGNQARFEADRQRCLDNLLALSGALRVVVSSDVVSPEAFAASVTGRRAADSTCFGGRIISAGTDYYQYYDLRLDGAIEIARTLWLQVPREHADVERDDDRIDEALRVLDSVFVEVQEAPGAGPFPWQYPQLVEPLPLP